jgi:hypothetical protein
VDVHRLSNLNPPLLETVALIRRIGEGWGHWSQKSLLPKAVTLLSTMLPIMNVQEIRPEKSIRRAKPKQ